MKPLVLLLLPAIFLFTGCSSSLSEQDVIKAVVNQAIFIPNEINMQRGRSACLSLKNGCSGKYSQWLDQDNEVGCSCDERN